MATKKATVKKVPAKGKKVSKAKAAPMKSFKVSPRPRPFVTFKFTDQSIYWLVIGVAVVALGLYVASLQLKINDLYDQSTMHESQSNVEEVEKMDMSDPSHSHNDGHRH